MISVLDVERQLSRIGVSFRFWGRAELRELPKILVDGEVIEGCVNGRYDGGFAMLCATDQRLLLIDKKPLFLSLTDLRYDMISEIDYGYQLINASIKVCTPSKNFAFQAWRQDELRKIAVYVQKRVTELRQHQTNQVATAEIGLLQQPQPTARPLYQMTSFQPAQAASGLSAPILPRQRYAANPHVKSPVTSRGRVAKFGSFLIQE